VLGAATVVAVTFTTSQGTTGTTTASNPTGRTSNPDGVGGLLLNLVSLGFLRPSVGAPLLVAIQTGFAIVLFLSLGALVLRWPKPPRSRARTTSLTRTVRVQSQRRAGYRPPPT